MIFSVGISLSNYRVCSDVDHEEKINVNDENRDLDRFVVSKLFRLILLNQIDIFLYIYINSI